MKAVFGKSQEQEKSQRGGSHGAPTTQAGSQRLLGSHVLYQGIFLEPEKKIKHSKEDPQEKQEIKRIQGFRTRTIISWGRDSKRRDPDREPCVLVKIATPRKLPASASMFVPLSTSAVL